MFKTLSNSMILAKECWEVLMQDKEMLVYPTLTSIFNLCILCMAYFYFLGIAFLEGTTLANYSTMQWTLAGILCATTLYACHFSYSFFECALVASAIKRLKGDDPTLMYGIGVASDRIPQLAAWSFYMTVFGIMMACLKSLLNSKLLRSIIGKVAETAWNIVTVFVLPIIVIEEQGAMAAAKKSTGLIRQKWGEAATLEIGFGALSSVAATPLAGLFIAAGFMQSVSPALSLALTVFAIVLGVLLGLVIAALSGIAKAVLYNYAVGGNIPDVIHKDVLDQAVVKREDNGAIIENRFQT